MKYTNYDRMRKQVAYVVDHNGCYVPQNRVFNHDGYLRVKDKKENRLVMMHRLAWEAEVGPIPEGYEIDHGCRNRCCLIIIICNVYQGKNMLYKRTKKDTLIE